MHCLLLLADGQTNGWWAVWGAPITRKQNVCPVPQRSHQRNESTCDIRNLQTMQQTQSHICHCGFRQWFGCTQHSTCNPLQATYKYRKILPCRKLAEQDGMEGQQKATLYFNNTDIRKNRPGINQEMISYSRTDGCLREFLLHYMGHTSAHWQRPTILLQQVHWLGKCSLIMCECCNLVWKMYKFCAQIFVSRQ